MSTLQRLSLLMVGLTLLVSAPAPAPRAARAAATPMPTPEPIVTTLAGPGYGIDGTSNAASFAQPQSIALSPVANFGLVADTSSHTIRWIDPSTRLVTTIAGLAGVDGNADGVGATARFTSPCEVSISPDGSFALVVDSSNGITLRRINLATTEVTTIGQISVGHGIEISTDGSVAWRIDMNASSLALKEINLASGQQTTIATLDSFTTNTPPALAISHDQSFALIAINGLSPGYHSEVWRFNFATKQLDFISGQAPATPYCDPSDSLAVLCYVYGIGISSDNSFALIVNDFGKVTRIDLSNFQVTTIAGRDAQGSDDNAVGTSATFLSLADIAISQDRSFALVIDKSNYNVRRISLSNPYPVSTVAGQKPSGTADGIGRVARFAQPTSIALSHDGSFALVIDSWSLTSLLRRVQVKDGASVVAGTVTTVLPLEYGRFMQSVALSSDQSFGLLLMNAALYRFDPGVASPPLTLVAGSAGASGSADGTGSAARFNTGYTDYFNPLSALAISPDGSFALLADAKNNTIRKITIPGYVVTTLAGDPGVQCAESYQQTSVCYVDSTDTAARFNRPVGIAISPDSSYALIADRYNGRLRRLNLDTGAVTTVVQPKGYELQSVALSADGSYALIKYNSSTKIYRVDTATWQVTPLLENFYDVWALTHYNSIALSTDGSFALIGDPNTHTIRLLGTPLSSDNVSTLAGQTGVSGTSDGTGFGAQFSEPAGVAVSDSGIALITDRGSHTLRRITVSSGDVLRIAGQPGIPGSADGASTISQLNYPVGVAIDRIATFGLVVDMDNHTIRRIDLKSNMLTTIGGLAGSPGSANGVGAAARFEYPAGVTLVCGDGPIEQADPETDCPYALVADTGNHTIRKIDLATNTVTTIAGLAGSAGNIDGVGTAARFKIPTGVSVARGGAFAIIADEGNGALRRIDLATGRVSTLRTGLPIVESELPALAGRTSSPIPAVSLNMISGCGDDRLLISNATNHTISQIDLTNGNSHILAGLLNTSGTTDGVGTKARFNSPRGITASCYEGGTVIVSDTGNSTARKVDPDTTIDVTEYLVYLPVLAR